MTIFERLAPTITAEEWGGKFIALAVRKHPSGELTCEPITALGYSGLSLFKLYRNARKAAGAEGFVVRFAPHMLPFVAADATDARVDSGNDLDEESFAERQMLYWERELHRIRKSL